MQTARRASLGHRIARDLQRHKWKYILMIPILIYLILFCYKPMYGLIIAFKNYKPALGFAGSKWVGLKYFKKFFGDYYFFRILRNKFLISLYSILWGFPAPILLALMLNELRGERFKRTVQTVTYIPHFISMVVICSIIRQFCLSDGVFNDIGAFFGAQRTALLQKPESAANAPQALADYIRIIREEHTKRTGGSDPLAAAMETYKDKKGYGGKRT